MITRVQKSVICSLFLLLIIGGCKRSCLGSFLKSNKKEIAISERINQGQLDNGLSYFYLRNESPKKSCMLSLNVTVGSFFEAAHESGMSHMVEHLAFEDRALSKDESLSSWFEKNGMSLGPDANAFTSTDHTFYRINLPTCDEKSVQDALQIFRSFASGLEFRPQDLSKQKNIIDAEEREAANAEDKLTKKLIERFYSGTSYVSHPVLGKKEVRDQFNEAMLKSFYDRWYQPKNLSIIVVGDYGNLDVPLLIKNHFADLVPKASPGVRIPSPHPDYKSPVFIVPEEGMSDVETVFSIQAKKLSSPNISPSMLSDRLAFGLALSMLSKQLISETNKSLLLVDPTLNGSVIDHDLYELSLSIKSSFANLEPAFLDAYGIIKQALDKGFEEQEFVAVKEALMDSLQQWSVTESTITSEDWHNRLLTYVNQKDVPYSAQDYITWVKPYLEKLTAKDCQRLLQKAFKSGNHYLFALGKITDSEQNLSLLTNLLRKAKTLKPDKSQIQAINFKYSVAPCNNNAPLKNTPIKNLQAFSMSLPNNIDIIVKPTSFKTDEIIMNIFTDEGYANMDERDFTTARLALAVLPEGGLGKHPGKDLPALMQQKSLSITASMFEDRIQASITTRNKDFRFALEYVRAFITDPLYAEDTLMRIKERIKVGYANLEFNIWRPLQHDFMKAVSNNDYRVGQAKLEDLLALSRNDLLAWHKKYISSKKLHVVAVGDVQKDEIESHLACVLSGLPTGAPSPKKATKKLAFLPGINKVYEVKNKDETSKIALRYPLNFPDIYPNHLILLTKNIIQQRLYEKFREQKQLSYSAQVNVSDGQNPHVQNWLDVLILAPKPVALSVKNDVVKSLDKLAQRGVKALELKKAQEPYLTQINKLLADNTYWAEVLANNFAQAASLQWIDSLSKDAQAIRAQDINKFLKTYFKASNVSSAIVHAMDGSS